MDSRSLRAFCTIAEHGSLTRAATALGDAQSALSRRISALESELAGRLFYRTGRGVVLTELGRRLLPQARTIVAEIEALAQDAQGERDSPSGTVEIGVVPGVSRPLVSTLCAQLREEYPRIRLRALEGYSGQVEDWLANGRVEVGIFNRYGRGTVRGAELLLQSDVALVASREKYPSHSSEITFRALRDLPFALPTRPNSLVALASDLAARQRFVLDVVLEAGTGALIRDAVARAGLCTLAPLRVAQRDYPAAEFSMARLVKPTIRQKTWLALTTQRPATRAARTVARMVRELLPKLAI